MATTRAKKVAAPIFTIKFTINDQIYEGTGATVFEALQSVPKPAKIMNKAYIQVTDGKRNRAMPLTVERAKRFFYPMAQLYLAKQLEYGLK